MKNIQKLIIEKIKINRISTTEIADCLDKTGAISEVKAINKGHFKVGRIFWVYAWNESNWDVHEQIRDASENDIVIIEPFDCKNRAIIGELVAKFLLLYKQVGAIVVLGNIRDTPHLIKENWPIWATGSNPVGCFNVKNEMDELTNSKIISKSKIIENAIAVCDDTGVVVILQEFQNEVFLEKLDWIEEQEDIWFDCIDRLKWDTFDTVCLKKYKKNE